MAVQALATKGVEGYYTGFLAVVAENIYLSIFVVFWHDIICKLFIKVLLEILLLDKGFTADRASPIGLQILLKTWFMNIMITVQEYCLLALIF